MPKSSGDQSQSDGSNADWFERDQRVMACSSRRTNDPNFGPFIVRGEGSRVWDSQGRQYYDLTCGYSAANFGHAFAPLVAAATGQLHELTHLTGMPHPGRVRLAERIVAHCGRPGDKVIFNTSGARAVETAWKAAASYRPGAIVALLPAYHGRSLATSAISHTSRMAQLLPARECYVQRPVEEFAYCVACPKSLVYPECDIACQRSLIDWIEQNAERISAVIAEPAIGARGYIAPPGEYWQRIRALTKRLGILMIADEIQMGLGRCGSWLLSSLQGWSADLVVLGKSLGGGITPISAVVGRPEIMDAIAEGCESETFAANPLGTAVGFEVMRQLATGPWMERSSSLGQRLAEALQQGRYCDENAGHPARVETCGASATIEFVGTCGDRQRESTLARNVAERFVASGLLVHYSGPYATRVCLLPALTIPDRDLKQCCDLLRQS